MDYVQLLHVPVKRQMFTLTCYQKQFGTESDIFRYMFKPNSNFFNNKTFRYSKQQIIITNIRILNEYMYCTCVFKKCLIMWKTLSHHFMIIYVSCVYGYSDCGTNTVTLLWTLSSGKTIIFKKAHFNLYILTEFDKHIL